MSSDRTVSKLEIYEHKTSFLMLIISLAFIILYAIEVISTNLSESIANTISLVNYFLWGAFAVDLIIRLFLADHKLRFLIKNPVDVLAVILPAFRALRILRIITAGQWLIARGSKVAVGRTTLAIVVGVIIIAMIGALAVFDVEKAAEGTNIKTFGDAVWWSFATISTGSELHPTTVTGRLVAISIMVVGISLVGLVSATMATWILDKLRGDELAEELKLQAKINQLETKIDNLAEILVRDHKPN